MVNISAKPGIVSLTLAHMDQSLAKEYGDHLEFNILSWNVNNRKNPEVSCIYQKNHANIHSLFFYDKSKADEFLTLQESVVTNSKDYLFDKLESGQNYCFQVEYLLYHKPYGKASEKRCIFIPETRKSCSHICIVNTL